MRDHTLSILGQDSDLRQDWDEPWRQRLDEAYRRYQLATARYRGLLEATPKGRVRSQDHPLALARRAESEALAEYTRLVKL